MLLFCNMSLPKGEQQRACVAWFEEASKTSLGHVDSAWVYSWTHLVCCVCRATACSLFGAASREVVCHTLL